MIDRASPSSALDVILQDLRVTDASYGCLELRGDWSIDLPFQEGVRFHYLIEGRCELHHKQNEFLELQTGDLVLLPHGDTHVLTTRRSTPPIPLADYPNKKIGNQIYRIQSGSKGECSLLVCGTVRFGAPAALRLLAIMPPLLELRSDAIEEPIASLINMMAEETRRERLGMATILPRIADVVIVWAMRHWLETTNIQAPWFAGWSDPHIGPVLAAMHSDPSRSWSISELASFSSMSRSKFIARFNTLVGDSPARYLRYWRLDLAAERIGNGTSILAAALDAGYGSEAAFNRAFSKRFGSSPGRFRADRLARSESEPEGKLIF